jgi:hypothetical protein
LEDKLTRSVNWHIYTKRSRLIPLNHVLFLNRVYQAAPELMSVVRRDSMSVGVRLIMAQPDILE